VILRGPEVAKCKSWIPGDINGDCKVNFIDFTIMAGNWLECDLKPGLACW